MVEFDSWAAYEAIGVLFVAAGLYVAYLNRSLIVGAVSLFLLVFVYAHYERREQLADALDPEATATGPEVERDQGGGEEPPAES